MATDQSFNMIDPIQRQDDIVYFSSDTSSHSWAGQIGDDHDMTDEMVTDYIKDSKPELFDKLRGMRFGSSDIPLTFQPHRDLRRLREMHAVSEKYTSRGREPARIHNEAPTIKSTKATTTRQVFDQTFRPSKTLRQPAVYPVFPIETQDQLRLDGIDHQAVLSAAERLYPDLTLGENDLAIIEDKCTEPDAAFKHSTNSPQSHQLRALKQLEINQALTEVSKYEKSLQNAKEQLRRLETREGSPDASVLITRPSYMEAADDRYKKQGLTQYDRAKYVKAQRREEIGKERSSHAQTLSLVNSDTLRICYCREYEDGSEVLRCSEQWCPVGWFHLRCLGLERLPFTYEEFYCAYCADGMDHQISQKILDGDHYDPHNPACVVVDQVTKFYQDQELETEVVFQEQTYPQPYTNCRSAMYQDEDESFQGEEEDLPEDEVNVVEKVTTWRAVNDPYPRVAVSNAPITPHDDRTFTGSPTDSFFTDDSDGAGIIAGEPQDLDDDASTIRMSSPTSAHDPFQSLHSGEDQLTDEIETEVGGSDAEVYKLMRHSPIIPAGNFIHTRRNYSSISDSNHSLPPYPPQPSTITDTTRSKSSGTSALSRPLSNLPNEIPDFSSPNDNEQPRTPILAPRTSKPSKPWGTPVNMSAYTDKICSDPEDFILAPISPSPAPKRKLSDLNDEESNSDRGSKRNIFNSEDVYISDSEEETEEVIVFASPPRMFKTLQLKKHENLPY